MLIANAFLEPLTIKNVRNFIILALAAFFLVACNKEDCDNCPCNINDPIAELDWLAEIVDLAQADDRGVRQIQILQYTYNGECVIWVDNCYNCSDKLIVVYDYEKEEVCSFGGIIGLNTCPDFLKTASDRKVLLEDI